MRELDVHTKIVLLGYYRVGQLPVVPTVPRDDRLWMAAVSVGGCLHPLGSGRILCLSFQHLGKAHNRFSDATCQKR